MLATTTTLLSRRAAIYFSKLTWNLIGISEVVDILCLTEVKRVVKFGQYHKLCTFCGQILYAGDIAGTVGVDILADACWTIPVFICFIFYGICIVEQ